MGVQLNGFTSSSRSWSPRKGLEAAGGSVWWGQEWRVPASIYHGASQQLQVQLHGAGHVRAAAQRGSLRCRP